MVALLKKTIPVRGCLLLLFTSVCILGQNYKYITGDIANIRSKPSSKASIIGTLHCTAFFTPTDSVEDWYYIKEIPPQQLYFLENYQDRSINGWVHKSLVSNEEFAPINGFNASTTLADSIKWAERCFISNYREYNSGLDKLFYQLLTDGYLKIGNKAKAQYYKSMLTNKDEVYIAHTHDGQNLVIGSIDTLGDFNSLEYQACLENETFANINGDDSNKIINLRIPLLSRRWHALFGEYQQVNGLYFPISYIFPFDDQEKNKDYYFKIGDVDPCANKGISLGKKNPVAMYHNIYATRSISLYTDTNGIDSATYGRIYKLGHKLAAMNNCGFSTLHFTQLPFGMIDVTIRLTKCKECGAGQIRRGVFDKKDSLVSGDMGNTFPVYNKEYNVTMNNRPWFSISGLDNCYYAIHSVVGHDCTSGKGGASCGLVLLRISSKGFKSFEILNDQCGD